MSLSPAFSNILQLSHLDRLINVLATCQVVTSMLFSSRTLSTISGVLVRKMYSVTVTHSDTDLGLLQIQDAALSDNS